MKRFTLLLVSIILVACTTMTSVASADVNNFTVKSFNADYYLSNADPQGKMRVKERIEVDFTDQNHGILRAVPSSYKNQSLRLRITKVSSDSGAPSQYSTYASNGNLVIKIGDPNQMVSGLQSYTIDYTEDNVITFYPDHDELYWNVNGDQWNQPFDSVSAVLHIPAGLKYSSQAPQCFEGGYGSAQQDCRIETAAQHCKGPMNANSYRSLCEPPANDLAVTTINLPAGSTLTFVTGFQKGYFHPDTWRDYVRDNIGVAAEFLVPILLIGGGSFIWWLKRGRDAKGSGTIIPQFDPPDGMTPLETGAIIEFVVDNRDLTATIISLAIRKYIRIIENEDKAFLGKNRSFSLQLLNRDWSGLNEWETQLLSGIFSSPGTQDTVTLGALAAKLYAVAKSVKKSVDTSLTLRGYFKSDPYKFVTWPVSAAVAVVFLAFFLHIHFGWLLGGIVCGMLIAAAFYHFMSARTAKGVAAKEHILGLKLYLEVAEKDRIAALQSPDAPYMPKGSAPEQTVELFEKLLPYAIVLKVEQQWAKQFKDIYTTPPDWYAGNFQTFSVGYLVGSLGDGFVSAAGAGFAAPRSASGSGFGGGGFAGGGGGGGGGGGW